MARGKYLSLEEARKMGNLDQFAKEHPSQADERFWPLLEAATGSPEDGQTSDPGSSADCAETRTPRDKTGGTSG
jgi:hypothetical protein